MIFFLQLGLKPGNPLQTSQCYFLAFSLDFCSKIIASKTKWQQFYLHNFLIFCYNLPFKHTFLCEIDWKIWSKLSIFQILVINWLNFKIKQKNKAILGQKWQKPKFCLASCLNLEFWRPWANFSDNFAIEIDMIKKNTQSI